MKGLRAMGGPNRPSRFPEGRPAWTTAPQIDRRVIRPVSRSMRPLLRHLPRQRMEWNRDPAAHPMVARHRTKEHQSANRDSEWPAQRHPERRRSKRSGGAELACRAVSLVCCVPDFKSTRLEARSSPPTLSDPAPACFLRIDGFPTGSRTCQGARHAESAGCGISGVPLRSRRVRASDHSLEGFPADGRGQSRH